MADRAAKSPVAGEPGGAPTSPGSTAATTEPPVSKRERQFFWGGLLLGALFGWVITLAILGLTGAIK